MIIDSSKIIGSKILSLQVGGAIATISHIVIDPENLKIIAFIVHGPLIRGDVGNILTADSVREFEKLGIVIDSIEDLSAPGDVIRVDNVLKLNFELSGLKVVTKKGTKLGKVVSYIVDTKTMMVRQLVVKTRGIKSISDPELIIPRSEIVEVTDYEIIVKDEEKKIRAKAVSKDEFIPNFVNPFREPDFAQANSQNPADKDN